MFKNKEDYINYITENGGQIIRPPFSGNNIYIHKKPLEVFLNGMKLNKSAFSYKQGEITFLFNYKKTDLIGIITEK
jgi:hypothetical protein